MQVLSVLTGTFLSVHFLFEKKNAHNLLIVPEFMNKVYGIQSTKDTDISQRDTTVIPSTEHRMFIWMHENTSNYCYLLLPYVTEVLYVRRY